MNEQEILAYLKSHDERLGHIESSLKVINHELGVLTGKVKNTSIAPLLIKYVVFPLIVLIAALAGFKMFLPF